MLPRQFDKTFVLWRAKDLKKKSMAIHPGTKPLTKRLSQRLDVANGLN